MMFSKCFVILWIVFLAKITLSLAFYPSCSSRRHFCRSTSRQHHSRLFGDRKNLSASSKERREEEKRRLERKADVVIGKTSAKPEAQNFQLNPTATQEEWMRQASNVEQKVFRETEKGMEMLKMVRVFRCCC